MDCNGYRKEPQALRDWLDQREIRVQKVHKVHLDCVVLSDPVGRLVLKDLQENVVNAETKVISLFLAFSCLISVDECKPCDGVGRCARF